ncbi:MAG: hypothetical protein IKE37_01460 [Firmicutes bacterium]|nr:hypothetical protein [Bacillota bacterium]
MNARNGRTIMKALIKLRLAEAFSGFGRRKRRGTSGSSGAAGKIILYIALAVFVMLSLGFSFFSIGLVLSDTSLMEMFFPIVFILAFLLCLVGSVFLAQHQIFEAKDNDLMFSMPIPPRMLLVSRILSLILVNYYYEAMILVPGAVVYGFVHGYSAAGFIFLLICAALTPLFVVTVSMIFGYLIALVSSRLRNSRIVGLVLSAAAFAAYFYFISVWPDRLQNLAGNGAEAVLKLKRYIAPAWHFGNAVHGGSALSLLIYALICIVPFAAACFIIGRNFIRIATTERGMKKIEYKGGAMKAGSSFSALTGMELRRLGGSNVYMLNSAFGLLIVLALPIIALVKKGDLSGLFSAAGEAGFEGYMGPIITIAFLFLGAMVFISSATVSLDSYTMWIAKSLPVSSKEILLSKAMPHILVSVPFFLIAEILIQFAVPMDPLWRVGVIILPLIATVHNALLGVVINLRFPKFDWLTEAYAVKQGLAPMLAMLLSAIIPLILIASFGLLIVFIGLPPALLFAEALVLYIAFGTVFYLILSKWGTARFGRLQS